MRPKKFWVENKITREGIRKQSLKISLTKIVYINFNFDHETWEISSSITTGGIKIPKWSIPTFRIYNTEKRWSQICKQ